MSARRLSWCQTAAPGSEPVNSPALATIQQRLRNRGRIWLFLDYDGTLVPIARTPDEAQPDSAFLRLLKSLARVPAIRTVVLSGRPLVSLQGLLPVSGLILAGTYGAEIQIPGHAVMTRIELNSVRPTLEQVKSAWGELIARRSGFFLEDKGLAVALHARFADSADADLVLPRAQAEARHVITPDHFWLLGGERFIEVAPALANKGQTVDWLIDHIAFADALPVYLGDDDKDEEAFAVIQQRGGIPIIVGQRQQSTQAIERVSSPQAVREWLQRVLPV